MSYCHYDRLSALDATFLEIEKPDVHMHVGAVAIFDASPLTNADGSLAMERIRGAIEAALGESPRFRQKLSLVPLLGHPVWVDDDRFNLNYHVRHTSLPHPGDVKLLKRLAGRIMSQKLDRGKPLWEMWVVEGVEAGQFATVLKAHHCMVDGISGLDLLVRMMRPDTDATQPAVQSWVPRPAPDARRLLSDELKHRVSLPFTMLRSAGNAMTRPVEVLGDLQEVALGFGEVLAAGLKPTSESSLNPEIGPHRLFDWLRTDLAAVKEVRSHLGGTVNDIVLASAAGAIGRFLRRRGEDPTQKLFRAQIPMSIRTQAEQGSAGNRVVMLMAELPIGEEDPRRRLAKVTETTARLKHSRQRAGVEFIEELSDRTLTSLFVGFARFATWQRSFNIVITNIPGPQIPVYLLGARMTAIYPLVPLAWNQAVGIALFSYDGGLFWGFNADWDALPDVDELVTALGDEFDALHACVEKG
jgi:diacylglycerol O-acyltransferase